MYIIDELLGNLSKWFPAAQAIMEDPKLLILDEPMNALDEMSIDKIRKIILDLKKDGVTIILTNHNSEDIKLLCDKVYEINSGELNLCSIN